MPSWARRNIFMTILVAEHDRACWTARPTGMCGVQVVGRAAVEQPPERRGGGERAARPPASDANVRRRRNASSSGVGEAPGRRARRSSSIGSPPPWVEPGHARVRVVGQQRLALGRAAAHRHRHDVGLGLAVGVLGVDEREHGAGLPAAPSVRLTGTASSMVTERSTRWRPAYHRLWARKRAGAPLERAPCPRPLNELVPVVGRRARRARSAGSSTRSGPPGGWGRAGTSRSRTGPMVRWYGPSPTGGNSVPPEQLDGHRARGARAGRARRSGRSATGWRRPGPSRRRAGA